MAIGIKNASITLYVARFFSWIFHPLFIPIYVTWYLVFISQDYFTGISEEEKKWVLLRVLLNMVFFPALSVLLLKGVGFIDSIFLKTQRDRIIPYIAAGIFYFWMYLVFRNQPEIPWILTGFVFGVFLASSAALLANIYFKVSMHAIGCGGMLGLMLIILQTGFSGPYPLPLTIALLITGLVCTSRMLISDHSQREIYFGLMLGMLCQFIAVAFIR